MGTAHSVAGTSIEHSGPYRGPPVIVIQRAKRGIGSLDVSTLQLVRQYPGLKDQLVSGVYVKKVAAAAARKPVPAGHRHPYCRGS